MYSDGDGNGDRVDGKREYNATAFDGIGDAAVAGSGKGSVL